MSTLSRMAVLLSSLILLVGCPPQPPSDKTDTIAPIAATEPWLKASYDERVRSVAITGAALRSALESGKPRPKIVRFKERTPITVPSHMIAMIADLPRSVGEGSDLDSAIARTWVSVEPLFSRAEYGIEQVDGPYPEEVQHMHSVAMLKALDGPQFTDQLMALEDLSALLASRSNITSEQWLTPSQSISASMLSGDPPEYGKEKVHYIKVGETKNEGGGERKRGGHARPEGDAGRPGESEPPGIRHNQQPRPAAPPVPPPQQPQLNRQPLPSHAQLEALSKQTEDLYQKVLQVRATNRPRPTIFVPRRSAEEGGDFAVESPDKDKILRKVGRFAPQTYAFIATLFDSEEICVCSETTPMPGPYPEELEFAASYNKLMNEALRADMHAAYRIEQLTQRLLLNRRPEWREKE